MKKKEINLLKEKNILITGGTGSFGQTVCKYFLNHGVNQIRIFSRDEKKQDEMRHTFSDDRLIFTIGDIRNYESIYEACYEVDYVFHAAALKQVPSCEFYPIEAVKTNIIGTENLLKSAISHEISKVVLLSTDKAVYPINSMGLTKAIMEKIMLSKSILYKEKNTTFCATRYGNVMGSRGSVIPLFINQIKNNKNITITNPNMTRFMMSLDEAVELVVHAFNFASKGDIFVQKSPACTLGDLVTALKEIFSFTKPDKVIGTRHGEKLYETLISKEEMSHAIEEGRYFKLVPDDRNLNYDKYFTEGDECINSSMEYNSCNTKRLSVNELKEILVKLDCVKNELN